MENDLPKNHFACCLTLRNRDEFSIIYEKYFGGPIWEISQTSENSIIGLFYPKI